MKNGETYEGKWCDGKLQGMGEHVVKESGTYKGEFKDTKRHGKGTFISIEGKVISGTWNKGVLKANSAS